MSKVLVITFAFIYAKNFCGFWLSLRKRGVRRVQGGGLAVVAFHVLLEIWKLINPEMTGIRTVVLFCIMS